MDHKEFIDKIRNHIIETEVSQSAMRNQLKPGILLKLRDHLRGHITLDEFEKSLDSETLYQDYLNDHTKKIRDKWHNEEKVGWGTARKCLNLISRGFAYNKYIANHLGLVHDIKVRHPKVGLLEIPLDKYLQKFIRKEAPTAKIPEKWKSIKSLTYNENKQYQEAAREIANKKGIDRIHLDLLAWRLRNEP